MVAVKDQRGVQEPWFRCRVLGAGLIGVGLLSATLADSRTCTAVGVAVAVAVGGWLGLQLTITLLQDEVQAAYLSPEVLTDPRFAGRHTPLTLAIVRNDGSRVAELLQEDAAAAVAGGYTAGP